MNSSCPSKRPSLRRSRTLACGDAAQQALTVRPLLKEVRRARAHACKGAEDRSGATLTTKRPPQREATAARDDRGAIMVMGIFICLVLVGALWFIAGVGDVLVFRERMQDASDATAFGAAVVEARGMNLLVLLNLLMAAIEAILVAINIIMMVTLVVAAVLAALSAVPGLQGLLELAKTLVIVHNGVEEDIHTQVKEAVYDALEAIHDIEQAIPPTIPFLAEGAALDIAHKYSYLGFVFMQAPQGGGPAGGTSESSLVPTWLTSSVSLAGVSPARPLPVKSGTTRALCGKSIDALAGAMDDLFGALGGVVVAPIAGAVAALRSTLGSNAGSVEDFFCELGDGGSPPDLSGELNQVGASRCGGDETIKDQCSKASSEQNHVNQLNAQCGNGSNDPDCQRLGDLTKQAKDDQDKCDDLRKQCQDGTDKGVNDAIGKEGASGPGPGDGDGKAPAAVDDDNWQNGAGAAQILSVVHGDDPSTADSRLVAIASQGHAPKDGRGKGLLKSLSESQAEFFYDCSGSWDSCDSDEEALWNFRWRARLRLVHARLFGAVGLLSYGTQATWAFDIIDGAWPPRSASSTPALGRTIGDLISTKTAELH